MKNILFPIDDFIRNNADRIGINVCKTNQGSHVGILYLDSEKNCKFLHLAFHKFLLNEFPDINNHQNYFWVNLNVDEILIPSIAQYCENIALRKENYNIPYGLLYRNAKFDSDGLLKIGNDVCGLSCSTFVLAVLEGAGLSLINYQTWKTRDEDIIAHNNLIEMLITYKVCEIHIENIKKEVNSMRYRPCEIAAAAINSNHPVDFEICEKVGQEIYEYLPNL